MTDPERTHPTGDEGTTRPDGDESIYHMVEKSSLLDESAADDQCPNCGRAMPSPGAVVCMHCGFDQVKNKIVRTKVGTVEVSDDPKLIAPDEFVRPGRLGWQAPLVIGAAATIAASVLSGMHAQHRPVWEGIATLLFAPVFAGIGVAATLVTAVLMEQRFGRLELAVARMMLAVGLVELSWHIGQSLELNNWLQFLIGAGVGAGLYYLVVWWFFSLDRTVAALLSGLHLSLCAVFMGLMQLNAWLATPPAAS